MKLNMTEWKLPLRRRRNGPPKGRLCVGESRAAISGARAVLCTRVTLAASFGVDTWDSQMQQPGQDIT
jgi:hypothetical protein